MSHYVLQLFNFMLLFEIDRFQLLEVNKEYIRAVVGWPDDGRTDYDPLEETQEIIWFFQSFENGEVLQKLIEILIDNKYMRSDKIYISEEKLQGKCEWDDEKFNKAICALLDFRVDMVDDGEKSDYFFVHF